MTFSTTQATLIASGYPTQFTQSGERPQVHFGSLVIDLSGLDGPPDLADSAEGCPLEVQAEFDGGLWHARKLLVLRSSRPAHAPNRIAHEDRPDVGRETGVRSAEINTLPAARSTAGAAVGAGTSQGVRSPSQGGSPFARASTSATPQAGSSTDRPAAPVPARATSPTPSPTPTPTPAPTAAPAAAARGGNPFAAAVRAQRPSPSPAPAQARAAAPANGVTNPGRKPFDPTADHNEHIEF